MDTPTDTPTDTPISRRWGSRGKKLGATALVAAGLVAGSVGVATAATSGGTGTGSGSSGTGAPPAHGPGGMRHHGGPGGPGGPGRDATVQSASATSLVVTTATGRTVTYELTGSTTYRQDGAAATVNALAPGELVVVRTAGPPSGGPNGPAGGSSPSGSSTTPTATEVDIVSPHVAGLVQSVSASGGSTTIVVADDQGFWHTIVTSASTTYTDSGSSVTSPTFTRGEFVAASGTIASDHTTLDATTVRIGAPTPPAGAPGNGAGGGAPAA